MPSVNSMPSVNKLVFLHGMNEEDKSGLDLLNDWNSHLFEKTPVNGTSMAFWGDLSVAQEKNTVQAHSFENVEDAFLRGLYKISTNNSFLGDCYNYFYDKQKQALINQRFFTRIFKTDPFPAVVLSHSLGTVIAYAALSKVLSGLEVPLFITVGSPLGLDVIRAELKKYLGVSELVAPACVKSWINFNDLHDIVALERKLAPFYSGLEIQDISVNNLSAPQSPHNIDGYLQTQEIRDAVNSVFTVGPIQMVPFVY